MKEKDFFEVLKDVFDSSDVNTFTLDTNFKDLEDWNSLTALSLIAAIDEEYGVTLSGNFIKSITTLGELYYEIKRNID